MGVWWTVDDGDVMVFGQSLYRMSAPVGVGVVVRKAFFLLWWPYLRWRLLIIYILAILWRYFCGKDQDDLHLISFFALGKILLLIFAYFC